MKKKQTPEPGSSLRTVKSAALRVRKSAPRPVSRKRTSAAEPRLFIAGIGAGAGGLEALTQFVTNLAAGTGVAHVVVLHELSEETRQLAQRLRQHCKLPVIESTDGVKLKADHVYLAPQGEDLAILHGVLHYMGRAGEPPAPPAGADRGHQRIDYFLRSLALDQRGRAICVILAGAGTDGTVGLRAIKGESGLAMVQEPSSASCSAMPQSAMDSGLCDYVAAAEQLPRQLAAYVESVGLKAQHSALSEIDAEGFLAKIFVLLRSRTGNDFSSYKVQTVSRRIERRMQVHQIAELGQYLRFVQQNPHELDILFKDLLIGVTSFFRDRACFEALASAVLPPLLSAKPSDYIVRVWVPGCSTGEEAYSLAIVLSECMERTGRRYQVQIYATDLDSHAISVARLGVYSEGIALDVGPSRLARYFTAVEEGYRINKEIREMVIFAPQNIISDPPFTRLDLLSCRNLLIYLIASLQTKLLNQFHYTLKPGGILLLGASETIGPLGQSFESIDKQWKIYRKKEGPQSFPGLTAKWLPSTLGHASAAETTPGHKIVRAPSIVELASRLLLDIYAPPSVLVNDKGDIIYLHGRTGEYLEPPPGQPTHNLLEMARGGLQMTLSVALSGAARQTKPVVHRGLRMQAATGEKLIDLTVRRLLDPEALRGLILVSFAPAAELLDSGRRRRILRDTVEQSRLKELERDLRFAKETLQVTVDEAQTANEELRTANEELHATNEEMQSTNEELETSKEEVQSLNEELQMVNAELQSKLEDLSRLHDDITNLLDSIDIATVFLTSELRIKRFTNRARQLIHLIPSDVGRPFTDIATRLSGVNVETCAAEVLRTQGSFEAEVQTGADAHYLMRINPCRTPDSGTEGVVLTFVDVTQLRRQPPKPPAAAD